MQDHNLRLIIANVEAVLTLTSGEAFTADTYFLYPLEITSAIVPTHFIARKLNAACWARISWLADARVGVVYTVGKIVARYF